jgi:aminoglycoside phosphotransferase (APT) family kinase protein
VTAASTAAVLEPYLSALAAWLAPRVGPVGLSLRAELVSGGRSNLTFALTDGRGQRYVLRRPPAGEHAASAHDVLREAFILAHLAGSRVPVPAVLGECPDPDVIGAPFFVMDFVDGVVLADAAAVGRHDLDRRRVAAGMIDALVAIHAVDLDAAGLGRLRRGGSYAARQLKRLRNGLHDDSVMRFPLLVDVHERLVRVMPAQSGDSLLHGDFKLGNVIVGRESELRAVLDWELGSVGEPVADVGWLLASWADSADGRWLAPPATMAGGFPSRADMAKRYSAASGLDLADLDYYVALALWRWSCINAATRRRVVLGTGSGTPVDIGALDAQIAWQLARALDLLDGKASVRLGGPRGPPPVQAQYSPV